MNNQLIKIEPPSLVEQKPFEDWKYCEKEKNQEEPQPMKEDTSKKKESSSKVNEKETQFHTCCYCGENRKLEKMAKTPQKHEEFLKWYRILGENFYENARKSETSMVCRSHFDDEFGESRLIDVEYMNNVVETKIGFNRRCCYCGKTKLIKNMTHVPKDEISYAEWSDILGEAFVENSSKCLHSFICRTHFDVKWQRHRPEGFLPIADLNSNINKKNHEKRIRKTALERSSVKPSPTTIKKDKYVCAYCGKKNSKQYMTTVTQNPHYLKEWVEILGQEFHERTVNKRCPVICRSHFNVQWKHARPYNVLPCGEVHQKTTSVDETVRSNEVVGDSASSLMEDSYPTVEIKKEEPDVDEERIKCCYCENQRVLDEMALVPRDKQGLTRWMNILGVEFYQNVMKNKHSYICRTHFNEQWKSEKTPKHILPVIRIEGLVEEQKSSRFLDNNIESEHVGQKMNNKEIVEKNFDSHCSSENRFAIKEENLTIHDRPTDKKIMKIEIKEEPLG